MILTDLWALLLTVPPTWYAALLIVIWAVLYGTPRKRDDLQRDVIRRLQDRSGTR